MKHDHKDASVAVLPLNLNAVVPLRTQIASGQGTISLVPIPRTATSTPS